MDRGGGVLVVCVTPESRSLHQETRGETETGVRNSLKTLSGTEGRQGTVPTNSSGGGRG